MELQPDKRCSNWPFQKIESKKGIPAKEEPAKCIQKRRLNGSFLCLLP
jgi:hypothetical protein